MVLGSLQRLFSSIQQGILSTIEGQTYLHTLCTQMKLNPAMEAPIALLKMSPKGIQQLQQYDNFIMSSNWLIAKVAAEHISIEEAAREVQDEMERLAALGNGGESSSLGLEHSCCPCCGDGLQNMRGAYG